MKVVFTICSLNYLSLALTLKKSIKATNQDLTFHIFLADQLIEGIDNSDVTIIEISKIQIPNSEFNTALKPFIIEYLIQEKGGTSVIYLDPDIKVFNRMDIVWNELGNSDFILTPPIIDPIQNMKFD